jgi:aspartyl-tRNA(Asn)/glutamyl-tRNA(Gln) amidotransferase subunit A
MGSVRVPSAYCGVVGFKPSFGRISARGVVPLSRTLDHIGFHANSASDVAALNDACAPEPSGTAPSASLRVGVVRTNVVLECAVEAAFGRAIDQLREAGARTIDLDWSGADLARLRRGGLLICERELLDAMPDLLNDPTLLSPELAAMLTWAEQQPLEKVAEARIRLARARELTRAAFAVADVLLLPTTPQVAFAHAAAAPENQADLTAIANVAGLPAVCLPLAAEGLPASLQILAPKWEDRRALDFAAFAERVLH